MGAPQSPNSHSPSIVPTSSKLDICSPVESIISGPVVSASVKVLETIPLASSLDHSMSALDPTASEWFPPELSQLSSLVSSASALVPPSVESPDGSRNGSVRSNFCPDLSHNSTSTHNNNTSLRAWIVEHANLSSLSSLEVDSLVLASDSGDIQVTQKLIDLEIQYNTWM